MSDGQQEAVYEQTKADCTKCARYQHGCVGWVNAGAMCTEYAAMCTEYEPVYHEGPPLAYQATGGAEWQANGGWGYRPLNRPAIVYRLRRRSIELRDDANALAAIGMGRGRYPEWSEELASLARRMGVWAGEIEIEEATQAAERGGG